jgi:hypothetical protein
MRGLPFRVEGSLVLLALLLPACDQALGPTFPGATPPSLALQPVIGTTSQLIRKSAQVSHVRTSGRWVVWHEKEDGEELGLHAYDIETGREYLVEPGSAGVNGIDVSGDRVVYFKNGETEFNQIYSRVLPSGAPELLGRGAFPQIDGIHAVWENLFTPGLRIHDFQSGTGFDCVDCSRGNILLSAGRIAWQGTSQATIYDIAARAVTATVDIALPNAVFAFSGDRLLAVFPNGSNPRTLRAYDLSTGLWTWISDNAENANHREFAIIGDRVIYPDVIEGLVRYDLASGSSLAIRSDYFEISRNIDTDDGLTIIYTYDRDIFLFRTSNTQLDTLEPIRAMIVQCEANGAISNPAIADQLRAFVAQAEENMVQGRLAAARNNLSSFVRYVEGRGRRQIESVCAASLVNLAQAASDGL